MVFISQSRTNLGALTTTFTAPASCGTLVQHCSTCTEAWQYHECANGSGDAGVHDNADCWPSRASGVADPETLKGWGFYSPGTICPSGYYSACSATGGGNSNWQVQFDLLTSETAVGCCPTGYTCTNGFAQTCIQQVSTSTTFDVVSYTAGTAGPVTAYTMPASLPVYSALTVISTYLLYAPLIQINFQSSDLQVVAAITSSEAAFVAAVVARGSDAMTSDTGITPSITSSNPAPASTTSIRILTPPPQSSNSPTAALSTPAKAGLGIGIGIAVIAVLIGVLLLYRRRRDFVKGVGNWKPEVILKEGGGAGREGGFKIGSGRGGGDEGYRGENVQLEEMQGRVGGGHAELPAANGMAA